MEKSTTNNIEPFVLEPMPMRKRQAVPVSNNQYRVIGDDGQHKDVEANTAYEAFKLAGMTSAIKIERLANARLLVVGQSYFLAENPEGADAGSAGELFDPSKLLKYPVLSADDLDKIMRSFSEQSARKDEAAKLEAEQGQLAAGTEVHNDGFDEIIPAKAVEKPAVTPAPAPAVEAKAEMPPKTETPPVASAAVPEILPVPEKALSPEEVNKLLSESKT